jgi:hypothetical protein
MCSGQMGCCLDLTASALFQPLYEGNGISAGSTGGTGNAIEKQKQTFA